MQDENRPEYKNAIIFYQILRKPKPKHSSHKDVLQSKESKDEIPPFWADVEIHIPQANESDSDSEEDETDDDLDESSQLGLPDYGSYGSEEELDEGGPVMDSDPEKRMFYL